MKNNLEAENVNLKLKILKICILSALRDGTINKQIRSETIG